MPPDDDATPEPPRGTSPARPPATFLDRPAADYAAPVLRDLAALLREADAALPAMLDATLAGRYRIVRQIGRGGMALVYLAEDLRHGRRVAIKLIRPELARDIGAARFLHEIAFLGRLQHPHIPPLLDSGEVQGLPFYVMPHVEGESLSARIARAPRLAVDEALRIARDVADALEHAHAHGVVHRDVKPDNILLQERHALVADFGIARALTRATGDTVTSAGVTLGTPAYMSPEQATGELELDGRSDVFSLGIVLHEMLAGEAPFRGVTPQAVIAQVISAPAPPIRERREGVPLSVTRILARALAKAPAERFQGAGEMREAIETALAELQSSAPDRASGAEVAPARGVAIRPFADVDADRSQRTERAHGARDAGGMVRHPRRRAAVVAVTLAAFALGGVMFMRRCELGLPLDTSGCAVASPPWILLTDWDGPHDDPRLALAARELLASALDESGVVATIPRDRMRQGLRLTGRPDTTHVDVALGRELAIRGSIANVITGRIDRIGRTYAVLVRVIDADSGTTLLAERATSRDADGLIPAIDQLSRGMQARLRDRPGALRSLRPAQEVATPSFAAFRLFVESREVSRTRGPVFSMRPLHEAIALDSAFASAWFSLGIAFNNLYQYDSASAAFAQAQRHAERLSDRERLLLGAWEARLRRDFGTALLTYDLVLRRYPKDSRAQTGRAIALGRLGRLEEALDAQRRALTDQPFGPSVVTLWNLSTTLMAAGRWQEAEGVVRQGPPDPDNWPRLWLAIGTSNWSTAESAGRRIAEHAAVIPGQRQGALRALASALAARGAARAADSVLFLAVATRPRIWSDPFHVSLPERDRLLLAFSTGARPGPSDRAAVDRALESDVLEGIWGPLASDPESARRALSAIRAWPPLRRAALGVAPKLLAAMIAADTGRWREVVDHLATEAAGTHSGDGVVPMWMHARWLVAQAYERLEMPDSAAWYYRRALDPAEAVRNGEILARGLVFSFAQQRLVVLYARMGRIEDARRHWVILQATFTHPDPELVPLIEEARTALAKAERQRG
jgi:tetratricopeptide (TPR) repeat protein/tRNA A-37 threonylcarbamoyl transferase component Bud32